MSAIITPLPVIERRSYGDPSWREQRSREHAFFLSLRQGYTPPRTRPLLVIDNAHHEPCRAPWRFGGGWK